MSSSPTEFSRAELELQLQHVLQYWFEGDLSVNYKTKWFPSGSLSLQAEADAKVHALFKTYLDAAQSGAYEQILTEEFQDLPADAPERKQTDYQALGISESLLAKDGWDYKFSVSQHVFALMPYRHSATRQRLYDVLKCVDLRESKEKEMMELIERFRKQTIRRLQHLEDRDKAKAGGDILERHPFVADESDIHSQGVLTSTRNFFLRHIERKQGAGSKGNSISGSGSNLIGEPKGGVQGKVQINHNIRPFSKDSSPSAIQFDPFPVAISLSGGVDSMVIAKILVTLRNSNQIPISEIIAIHIDYANREESSEEADFVENWCKELGITFHKRTINEVTRGITNRDEYEKVTREIRYSFYKSVLEESNCEAVIFGHHLGDVQENVISNVMRGSNPLQLSGMTEIGVTNGVSVWRPLLSHPKDDIYEFSHKYGVPYFKDTTPSWSTRGKLRNKLIPLLLDMYGEGCLRNLTSLANESDSFRELVDQSIFLPFTQSIRRTKCGIIVNIVAYKNQPLCFWKEALMEIMHSMSMSMVREKSVGVFMERIQRKSTDMAGWLELRKGFHTYLYENGDFCVIADGILGDIAKTGRILNPNRGSNSLKGAVDENASSSSCAAVVEDKSAMNCWSGLSDNEWNWKTGLTVDLSGIRSEALSMKIGIWAVSISWVSDSSPSSPNPLNSLFKRHLEAETTPAALKESLALSSIRDVFSGSFEYLSAVPSHVNTLAIWSDFIVKANSTFPEISKFSPVPVHALSKSDPRIRLGIPFLVPITPDAKALSAEQIKNISYSYTLIKVTYRLDKK